MSLIFVQKLTEICATMQNAKAFCVEKSITNLGGVAFALGEGSVPVGRLATVKCVVTYCSRQRRGERKEKKQVSTIVIIFQTSKVVNQSSSDAISFI